MSAMSATSFEQFADHAPTWTEGQRIWRVAALALTAVAEKLTGRSVWLTIGNNDARVGTDDCVAFARRLVTVNKPGQSAAADTKLIDVAIEVLPSAGHRTPEP